MNSIFITGIGTNVGKTIAAAILAEALEADYWKPIQAGFADGTDAGFIRSVISNKKTIVHPETYKLKLAASPHIAAREEGIKIELDKIAEEYLKIVKRQTSNVNEETLTQNSSIVDHQSAICNRQSAIANLIIESAGGLMAPLNENEFVIDLVKKLDAKVILVSRNYLGSINHSLLTAAVCKQHNLDVLGWIFNDEYMSYEDEIVRWSGYPKIASLPFAAKIDSLFIRQQAEGLKLPLE
jgi:dethiobiotin synthetase